MDKKQFEDLCALQCTKDEICAWFDFTDKTLDARVHDIYGDDVSFSDIFRQKRGKGKISLRRTQWDMAKKNPTMALWLGKQYLGQTDQQKIDTTHEIKMPLGTDEDGL